jgi:hypothetical protein
MASMTGAVFHELLQAAAVLEPGGDGVWMPVTLGHRS